MKKSAVLGMLTSAKHVTVPKEEIVQHAIKVAILLKPVLILEYSPATGVITLNTLTMEQSNVYLAMTAVCTMECLALDHLILTGSLPMNVVYEELLGKQEILEVNLILTVCAQ